MMNIKKIAVLSLTLCCTAGVPAMFQTPGVASAHVLSCAQERGIGAKVYHKAVKGHNVQEAQPGSHIASIQDRIVQYNSDRLNLKDGKHKRYLARTVVDYTPNYPNAFMAPGGYNVIYNKEIEIDRTYDKYTRIQDDPVRSLTPADYTARSNVAATLAHEYGHYANADFLRAADRHVAISVALACIPTPASIEMAVTAGAAAGNMMVVRQESFAAESGADATALEFLDNVPEYSMGSAVTCFRRYQKYMRSTNQNEGGGLRNFLAAHSHTDTRIDRARAHIAEVSDGRVQLADDGRLTVDGQLLCGTGYLADQDRADGRERTDFLAGQIASTMARHLFTPEHLATIKESEFVGGSSDRTVLIACAEAGKTEGHGRIVKFLGTFDYPLGKAERLLTTAQRKAKAELESIWDLTRTLRARIAAKSKT